MKKAKNLPNSDDQKPKARAFGKQPDRAAKPIELVYGLTEWGLVFIPRGRAERLAAIHAALRHSKTWGEFRRRVGESEYQQVTEGRRTFEDWCDLDLEEATEEELRSAREQFRKLPIGHRVPDDDDPFDSSNVPGFCDGDYPPWPAQEMLQFVPYDIQQEYGEYCDSVLNGDYLGLDPEQEEAIVAAFTRHGYQCTCAEGLVGLACGYA